MSEVRNIPRLRFPNYNDNWLTFFIKDISKVIRGASPRPKGDPRYYGGNVPRLMGSDVTRDGKYVTPKTDFLTDEGAKKSRFLPKGSLTMTCSGNVGIPSFLKIDACIHDGFLAFIDKSDKIEDDFLYYSLFVLKEKLERGATHGGVFTNLTTQIVKDYSLSIPSLPEQQKIADFLTAVDKRIELLEKKKTLLETYKKGVMKKIFNQEIRFKDDNGKDFPDWEEKRLGEVCKLQGGYAFKSNSFKDEGIPIIRISNISNDNNYLNLENLVHYDEISNDENFTILKGDLLIAMSGATTGKTSISNYDGKCYLNQRVGLFKSKTDKLNYSYLVQFVYSPVFGSQLIQFLVAGAQPNISSKDIESVTIPFPSIVEQQKISQFLSSIDTKLKLIESQIDKSKTWKKGILQKMFV